MRRLIARTAALAAAIVATVLSVAAPAMAGGPTSVLVVDYDGSRAAGAMTGSRAYADLERSLDAYAVPSGDPTAPGSFMASQVRLTWMIHDVTPWRVDAISINGEDVWVETAMDTNGDRTLFDTPGVRHRAADPELLLATLESLGVIGAPSTTASTEPVPTGATGATDELAAVAAPDVADPTGAADVSGGVLDWLSPASQVLAIGLGVGLGVALGVAFGLGLGRRLGRRRSTGGEPASPSPAQADDRIPPVGFTVDPERATR